MNHTEGYVMRVTYGSLCDIPAIKHIANQFNAELGFVQRGSLERAIEKRELFVAKNDEVVVGFVNWHTRRDGWSTIYELGVHKDFHGRGVGRMLLYAVPCPIRLKCTQDNEIANRFYKGAGMVLARTEPGKKRPLNVYEMRILNIIVRGSDKSVPDIARCSGSAYGTQEHDIPYTWPFMLDVEFDEEKVNWRAYLEKVYKYRPTQALVVDYASPSKCEEMLRQVQDLREAGVLRIVVCVKFHGAARDVPEDCIIGVSLRTRGRLTKGRNKFAGFMPDFYELMGRKCHLLGGSPKLQKITIAKLQGYGAHVLSADGNAQFGSAELGSTYGGGLWNRRNGEPVERYASAQQSSINIQRELNAAAAYAQLPLFET